MKTKLCHFKWLLVSFFCLIAMSGAAQVTVTGVVTDEAGEPLIGATVLEKGKQNGAATDIDGNFKISVPDNAKTLTEISNSTSLHQMPLSWSLMWDMPHRRSNSMVRPTSPSY